MRILIVFCHPVPESFGAAVRDRAIAALEASGHDVRLIDLYAEGFDPVMSADERRGYHTPGDNEQPVAEHLERLRWCEGLIFIYPTWWYGPPAMLKGWLDRVLVPHATFVMPVGARAIGPVLTNIRLIGAISTLGSPWWWWMLMEEPGRRMMIRGLRPLIARQAKSFWLGLHRMDSVTADERLRFLDRVEAKLKQIA